MQTCFGQSHSRANPLYHHTQTQQRGLCLKIKLNQVYCCEKLNRNNVWFKMTQWLLEPRLLGATRTMNPKGKSALLLFIGTSNLIADNLPSTAPRKTTWPTTAHCTLNTRRPPAAPVRAAQTQWEEGRMFKSTRHHTHKQQTHGLYMNISCFLHLIGKTWYYCLRAAEIKKNEDKVSSTVHSAFIKA